MDAGLPVHYEVSWGDAANPFNSTLDQNTTSGTNETFNWMYPQPGEYSASVTAYNLHSEPYGYVKYTHNLSR